MATAEAYWYGSGNLILVAARRAILLVWVSQSLRPPLSCALFLTIFYASPTVNARDLYASYLDGILRPRDRVRRC